LLISAIPSKVVAANEIDPPGSVARLSYLQGSISFQPAGTSDWVMAAINRPITSGDKLWVDAGSRAEVQIGSAAVRLSSNTGFSFLNLDDDTVQIQLSAGDLNVTVRHLDRDEVFEVDTPNQAFSILQPGHYSLYSSDDGNTTVVTVREGQGEAGGAGRTYTIESGQTVTLTGTDSLEASLDSVGRRDHDDFDEWCETRDRREARSTSMRYVSPEMVGYQDLDDNGYWRHDPEYGEVWMPTAIPAGWAPYRFGHWSWISPWGWTWVDDASWGYAPFHYGRWVYSHHAWGWVPGPVDVRPVYAPALVAFVGGPNISVGIGVGGAAVVGWFPLGPREVYVPGYRVSPEYVNRVNVSNTTVSSTTVTNVYNTTVINNVNTTQVTKIEYVNRSAPSALTAVSQTSFASAQPVASSTVAIDRQKLGAAQVTTRAEVAPTRNSLAGPVVANDSRVVRPPTAVLDRPVVAKTAPPPPPVPFERQQGALAKHPGQPLASSEVENLRPANMPNTRPLVRSVAAPANANAGRNSVLPAATGPSEGSQPPNISRNESPNSDRKTERPSADLRNGNSESQQKPEVGNVSPKQVGTERVSMGSPEPSRKEESSIGSPASAAPRNDRPLSAQPNYRAPETNQPSRQFSAAPTQVQSTTQPSREQPSYRPAQVENAPNAQPGDFRSKQASSVSASQPVGPSPTEPRKSTAPPPSPSAKPNLQPASNIQAANPAPAPRKDSPSHSGKEEDKDKKK
jgi:hypothetical protein